jgi:non-specific serine/threonine protein kinase
LLQRLSVFHAGWTLEAAEAVCIGQGTEPGHVLAPLMRLVEKSMVMTEEQPPGVRYRLLETVRQYAWRKLVDSGAAPAVSARFYEYYLHLAGEAAPRLKTAEQITWLPRLEAEQANFLAALDWSMSGAAQDSAASLRLATALEWIWWLLGSWSLARDRLEAVLTHSRKLGVDHPSLRAKLLNAVGFLSECTGSSARALEVLRDSEALCRATGDAENLAFALAYLGEVLTWDVDPRLAEAPLEECLALFDGHEPVPTWRQALALKFLAETAFFQNDLARADSLLQESISLFRRLGERWGLANTLESNAAVALRRGHFVRAEALLKEGLNLQQEMNYPFGWVHVFNRLGRAIYEARANGHIAREAELLAESLALAQAVDRPWGMADSLRRLADQAAAKGQPERAARLLGAAEVIREASGTPLPPYPFNTYQRGLADLKSMLGLPSFDAAWAEGRAMNTDQALAYALEGVPPA